MSPVKINETVVVSGSMINASAGIARLCVPIEGSDTFRATPLNKYENGDVLELHFRVSGGNRRQLVKHVKIDPKDRFTLTMVDYSGEAEADEVAEHIASTLKLSQEQMNNVMTALYNNQMPVVLQPGLTHFAAYKALNTLMAMDQSGKMAAAYAVTKRAATAITEEDEEEAPAAPVLEWIGNHWIPENMRPLFKALDTMAAAGGIMNVLLTGPSGYGKTSTFEALAEHLGYTFLRVNCATVMDTEAWFGYHEARDGSTVFIPTDFTKAVRQGKAVILLDEANRIEPWLANSLLPMLDHARCTTVHGEEVKVAPSVIFGLTMNIGVMYAGTHTTDAAFMNRMDAIERVSPPPREVEIKIVQKVFPDVREMELKKMVMMVEEVRAAIEKNQLEIDASTRTLLKMTNLVNLGLTPRQAARYVLINSIQNLEDRKPVIDIVNSRLGTEE